MIKLSELTGKRWIEAKAEKRYCCIFCEDDKFHMYVNTEKMLYHCFKCGEAGRIFKESTLEDFSSKLDKLVNETKGVFEGIETKVTLKTLPRCLRLDRISNKEHTLSWLYLKSRGVTMEEAIRSRAHESIDRTGIYSNTVIFPLYNEEGMLDYFVCRKIKPKNGEPKYVNAPWPKNGALYTQLSKSPSKSLVIVEGIFDAIRVSRVSNVVALLGKKATKEQLENIIKRVKYPWNGEPRDITIMLDVDAFGHAVKLKLELQHMGALKGYIPAISIASLPGSSDPGSASADEIMEAIRSAR